MDSGSCRIGFALCSPGSSSRGSLDGVKKFIAISGLLLLSLTAVSEDLHVKWIHGSDPCSANSDPAFQVHYYNADTVILRENKCINYEGPFIYLLFGHDKVLMQDTGAAPSADSNIAFPVRETVQKIVDEWAKKHNR